MADKTLTVLVCEGTGCVSAGSENIFDTLNKKIESMNLNGKVELKITGCHGFCQAGPIVILEPDGIFYSRVSPEDAAEIAESLQPGKEPVKRLFYVDPVTGEPKKFYKDINFYNKQQRVILRNCGHIDPTCIDDYLSVNGYEALRKALLQMTPDEIIDEVSKSGLRGLGGAGFPTGRKWLACRLAPGDEKYVICNADEGDPGAFQDRSVLEGDPHSVVEGMTIAGYAVGAEHGFVYVRAEYPLAVKRLRIAIESARDRGFLGKDILGSGFNFDISIFQGAGAFVCGEETALIASIEGKRGMPRTRPPFPAHQGLWNKPTLIDNVKTLASIRWIINEGSAKFSSRGTATSKGTAVFSLTGKIANCGLIEVPMGITMREIIYGIGGGIPGGKEFKAVQTGGPSGGCLPAELLDTPVDFDSLKAAGSMMGSGGMVVMDEDTCMVDVARYFLDFTQKESCGKCVPCRLGTKQMINILERITSGEGREGDVDLLVEMATAVKAGSLCGLGQTAPNPVLTTIRYFRGEYEAHIHDRECPARVCPDLMSFFIDPEKCKGCTICLKECPVDAITGEKKTVHVINQAECIRCGVCETVCPPRINAVQRLPGKLE